MLYLLPLVLSMLVRAIPWWSRKRKKSRTLRPCCPAETRSCSVFTTSKWALVSTIAIKIVVQIDTIPTTTCSGTRRCTGVNKWKCRADIHKSLCCIIDSRSVSSRREQVYPVWEEASGRHIPLLTGPKALERRAALGLVKSPFRIS